MAMHGVLAQGTGAPSPILPASTETVWGAVSIVAPLIVIVVLVALVVRYLRRLRRAAEDAARRASATEREVVALRKELREKSA